MEPYTRYEHAGVIVEIVQDEEQWATDPITNQDNAGTIYSWTRDWDGDEQIREPEVGLDDQDRAELAELEIAFRHAGGRGVELAEEIDELRSRESLPAYMARNYDAVLTLPLYYADYGSSGARIYMSNRNPNCAICFTQEDLDKEWNGSVDDATKYAEARIHELDQWMQGNVWGIVIRERAEPPTRVNVGFALDGSEDEAQPGEVLESVWGFIGEPNAEYVVSEANSMAESCAEQVQAERRERFEWECRDVVTV